MGISLYKVCCSSCSFCGCSFKIFPSFIVITFQGCFVSLHFCASACGGAQKWRKRDFRGITCPPGRVPSEPPASSALYKIKHPHRVVNVDVACGGNHVVCSVG